MCRTPARAFRPTSPTTGRDLFMAMTWLAGQQDTALQAKTRAVRPGTPAKTVIQTRPRDDRLLEDRWFRRRRLPRWSRRWRYPDRQTVRSVPERDRRAEATSTLSPTVGALRSRSPTPLRTPTRPADPRSPGAGILCSSPMRCGAVHSVVPARTWRSSPPAVRVDRHRRRHMSLRRWDRAAWPQKSTARRRSTALGVGRRDHLRRVNGDCAPRSVSAGRCAGWWRPRPTDTGCRPRNSASLLTYRITPRSRSASRRAPRVDRRVGSRWRRNHLVLRYQALLLFDAPPARLSRRRFAVFIPAGGAFGLGATDAVAVSRRWRCRSAPPRVIGSGRSLIAGVPR